MAMTLMGCTANSRVTSTMQEHIRENLTKDLVAQTIMNLAKKGKTCQFSVKDGLLCTKGRRLFVPKVGDLRRILLRECHDTLWVGHLGW